MVTESADGSELAVTLPPPLEEWLEERAAALGVDREEVLVELVSAYRAAADLEDESVSRFASEDEDELDERIAEAVESRVPASESTEDVEELQGRIETLESETEESIEDVRSRLLQVRDAVKERAPTDHSHKEMRQLSERVDGLSENLENVGSDVTETTESVDELDARLSDVESKLDRLARVVVALRKQRAEEKSDREEQLEHIKRQANQQGIDEAQCAACSKTVQIGLLTEPACPHCGTEARDVEPSSSVIGRGLGISKAKLTGVEAPPLEADDE